LDGNDFEALTIFIRRLDLLELVNGFDGGSRPESESLQEITSFMLHLRPPNEIPLDRTDH
jgi:hypothetical protein